MTYAQAFVNYCKSIQCNNQFLSESAVCKIPDLFHGQNHLFYQTIKVYSFVHLFVNV